jgi:hypothetical protein
LDADDGLGAGQPQRQAGIVSLKLGQFGCERIWLGWFRAAPGRRQRTEAAGIAVSAPVRQRRGVDALAAQNGTDATGLSSAVSGSEDPQLVLSREGPAARAIRQLG